MELLEEVDFLIEELSNSKNEETALARSQGVRNLQIAGDLSQMTPSEPRHLLLGDERITFASRVELLTEFRTHAAKWDAILEQHNFILWMPVDGGYAVDITAKNEED